MIISSILIGLGIVTVWAPSVTTRCGKIPLWQVLLGAALIAALALDEAKASGIAVCGLAWLAGVLSITHSSSKARLVLKLLTVLLCFALGAQQVTGFGPVHVVPSTVVSSLAEPMVVNLRIDAGVAGLLLLALYTRRITSLAALRAAWRPSVLIAVLTTAAVMAMGVAVGHVAYDPKLPWFTALHLARIALWTCALEEGFFRGVIQDGLARIPWVRQRPWLAPLPIILASLLFGMAHARGGPVLVALATLAGIGYGYAYHRTGRIEAAMLAHFTLNTVHFLLFTYPSIAKGA